MRNWDDSYAGRASRLTASEMREILKVLDRPGIISFAGGIPDPALFPQDEIKTAFAEILSAPGSGRAALQYAVSEGYQPLREWIAGYMKTLGVACTPENILITSGSQQALDFLGKLFIGPGDTVLTECPTYLGALQAFNVYEPVYAPLPDIAGNTPPETRTQSSRPRLGYAMSDFRNPTGTSASLAQRWRLLDAARALEMPLIEDAAYEALRYDGERIPSLLALEVERTGSVEEGLVIYCGTFSKTIVPGMRVGWVVAPRAVIRKLVLIKQAADLHSSSINQAVLHQVASKTLPSRIDRLRLAYRPRRDAMLAALSRHMPLATDWTRPDGGMFAWVTLPESLDGTEVFSRALGEAQVAVVPGRAFFTDGSGHNTMRLNFTRADPATIEIGIARLGGLLNEMLAVQDGGLAEKGEQL